jgi:general secretion pathway protein I
MIRNFRAPRRLAAFTLIEVMVALTIVALSLSAVVASVSQMVTAASAMQERTYASWIAQNKISEIRLSDATAEVSETKDLVDFASVEWALRTTISETGVENLYRIDVAVSYVDSDQTVRTVTGFVGEPGIPGQSNLAWTSGSQAAGEEK